MNSRLQTGITMLEVLVVMGIFVIVSGGALFFSMDTFSRSTFQGDRELLVSLLQRARAQSINNVCTASGCSDGKSHGVAIVENTYVLFEGASYVSPSDSDAVFAASEAVARSGDSQVVFAQLTGTTTLEKEFVLTSGDHASTITVETNGRIWWTN